MLEKGVGVCGNGKRDEGGLKTFAKTTNEVALAGG